MSNSDPIPEIYRGAGGANGGASVNGGYLPEQLLDADATVLLKALAPVLGRLGYEVRRKDGPRRSFGDFLLNVQYAKSLNRDVQYRAQKRLNDVYETGYEVTKAALNEQSGTGGGYIIPTDYSAELLDTIAEEDFIFPRAHIVPFIGKEAYAPKIDVETVQSAGTSPFFGGINFTWGSEPTPPETENTFRDLGLTAWDLVGYAKVSNQWLMDSNPLVENQLIKMFGKAAAWAAEYAFLQGKGADASMPLGVLNAPGSLLVTRQTTSTITSQDLAGMTAALLPWSWNNAIWACSPKALTPIQQLSQYFINIELGGLHKSARQAAGVLFTKPLFVTEKLPAPGANVNGDIILFDPWLYIIGMRKEVIVDFSADNLFQNYQSVYRVWLRLDGKCQVSNTVTLQDGSTKVSPYVVLQGK